MRKALIRGIVRNVYHDNAVRDALNSIGMTPLETAYLEFILARRKQSRAIAQAKSEYERYQREEEQRLQARYERWTKPVGKVDTFDQIELIDDTMQAPERPVID